MPALPLSFDEVLSTTRTVRKRLDLDRPVEREVLEECFRLSQQAPSGSNMQTFHYVVVTDQDRRNALGELFRRGLEQYRSSPIALYNLAYPDGTQTAAAPRIIGSLEYLADHVERVPVHVFACMEGSIDQIPPTMMGGMMGSIIPAVWSYMLAARSRGLGTCWSNMHSYFSAEADEIIGLPTGVTQIACILTAYTLGTDFKVAQRRPLSDIVHWDTW